MRQPICRQQWDAATEEQRKEFIEEERKLIKAKDSRFYPDEINHKHRKAKQ